MKTKKIGILNLPNANISSIGLWAERSDFNYTTCEIHDDLNKISGLILPGVGHFDNAAQYLKDKYWHKPIEKFVNTGKPILGICLGMHLLFNKSEEGSLNGLNFFDDKIELLKKGNDKIPNIGWRKVSNVSNKLNKFYFMHSYCLHNDMNKFNDIEYSVCNTKFIASFRSGNIYGCQYHPEKSYSMGDEVFRNIFHKQNSAI